jgi:hypothetical protein
MVMSLPICKTMDMDAGRYGGADRSGCHSFGPGDKTPFGVGIEQMDAVGSRRH